MARRGPDQSKPLPKSLGHMQRNVPLNGVRGWQRKKPAVAHAEHWPYGALDFSQNPTGHFTSVPINHVPPSSPEEPAPAPSSNFASPPRSMPAMDVQPRGSSRPRRRVDSHVRPRRNGGRSSTISSASGSSNPITHRPRLSEATESAGRSIASRAPHSGIPQQFNRGLEVQTPYTLPPGVNVDIVSRPFVPASFESQYLDAHPALGTSPQTAERGYTELSIASYSTPSTGVLSSSTAGFYNSLPDAEVTGNPFMQNTSLAPQRHGSASSSSLSADSYFHEINASGHQQHGDYSSRTRVNSHPSFAHFVNPGIHQRFIVGHNPGADYYYSSAHSPSASTASSSLDSTTFFSPASESYMPSGDTHQLADAGLQGQPYGNDTDLQRLALAQTSFPSYTFPGSTMEEGTYNPYQYDPSRQI